MKIDFQLVARWCWLALGASCVPSRHVRLAPNRIVCSCAVMHDESASSPSVAVRAVITAPPLIAIMPSMLLVSPARGDTAAK